MGIPTRPTPLPHAPTRHTIRVLPRPHGLAVFVVGLMAALAPLHHLSVAAFAWVSFMLALLACLFILSQHNLTHLTLVSARAPAVHANTLATVFLTWACQGGERQGLSVDLGTETDAPSFFSLQPGLAATTTVTLLAPTRGTYILGPLRITSLQPLGLARVFQWFWPQGSLVVYPSPEENGPLWPSEPTEQGASEMARPRPTRGDHPDSEDALLRPQRPGDGLHHISWKASARHGALLTRTPSSPTRPPPLFAWSEVAHLPVEQALSRLTRWVMEADRRGLAYSLSLPAADVGPDRGPPHLHRCLMALANA